VKTESQNILGYLLLRSKQVAQSIHTPIRRKFVQSGHPATDRVDTDRVCLVLVRSELVRAVFNFLGQQGGQMGL
jgi:hypothetical protein